MCVFVCVCVCVCVHVNIISMTIQLQEGDHCLPSTKRVCVVGSHSAFPPLPHLCSSHLLLTQIKTSVSVCECVCVCVCECECEYVCVCECECDVCKCECEQRWCFLQLCGVLYTQLQVFIESIHSHNDTYIDSYSDPTNTELSWCVFVV